MLLRQRTGRLTGKRCSSASLRPNHPPPGQATRSLSPIQGSPTHHQNLLSHPGGHRHAPPRGTGHLSITFRPCLRADPSQLTKANPASHPQSRNSFPSVMRHSWTSQRPSLQFHPTPSVKNSSRTAPSAGIGPSSIPPSRCTILQAGKPASERCRPRRHSNHMWVIPESL